jgi:predicted TIM-barrel fold metal-dependent hydrolase
MKAFPERLSISRIGHTGPPTQEVPLPCAHALPAPEGDEDGITLPLPGLSDEDGPALPGQLPPVIDAHVHLFPDRIFDALWNWFDTHAWPVRHRLYTPQIIPFLLERGVEQIVALHYAHRPGLATSMNDFMAQVVRTHPQVTGTATVFPGEEGAVEILKRAWAAGLHGVKLHCHVQCFSPDTQDLEEIYALCEAHSMPLVMHAGREPKSAAYACDPHELCHVSRVEEVLRAHPRLKLCVPHLGADEFDEYLNLLEIHENLLLDTTMMVAGFFATPDPKPLIEARPDRIFYGTDFPNLPFAWDREVGRLARMHLKENVLADVLGQNARRFFNL